MYVSYYRPLLVLCMYCTVSGILLLRSNLIIIFYGMIAQTELLLEAAENGTKNQVERLLKLNPKAVNCTSSVRYILYIQYKPTLFALVHTPVISIHLSKLARSIVCMYAMPVLVFTHMYTSTTTFSFPCS